MSKKYKFRREDNGRLIQVSFERMMQADAAGYITLEDGVVARRCRDLEPPLARKAEPRIRTDTLEKPIVSDALGFPQQQFDDFEADRLANRFTGVEFRRDPQVPEFYQVHFSDRGTWKRYVKHRGYADRNGANTSKVLLSEREFEQARELVARNLEKK